MSFHIQIQKSLSNTDEADLADIIFEQLKEGEHYLVFTKKNGETREMKCTLNSTMIEEKSEGQETLETLNEKKENSGPKLTPEGTYQISVFDLENMGWRSFLLNRGVSLQET